MFLYTVIEAFVGVLLLIVIAGSIPKSESISCDSLGKVGVVTNVILSLVYICLSPFYMFLGMISSPACEGTMGILGWIVSIFIASAALFCGLGIGLSVRLRRQGNSKLSFAIQFLGVLAIGLAFLLFYIFYGNLLSPLN